ncbi:12 TM domain-containing transmembrane protein [Acrasis kona]|uniref:12 TM domain-containing transmembrane protein n=1 Tax=Acrasis kona TaxID=1008807 RepID=A0AAW2YK69_9EUKA
MTQATALKYLSENKGKLLTQISLCLALFFQGTIWSMIGPSLPMFAVRTHTKVLSVGYIVTARALGNAIGGIITGNLMDKYTTLPQRRGIIIFTMICLAASLSAATFVSHFIIVLVLNVVAGLAVGSMKTFCNTLVGYLWREQVNIFLQMQQFCFGIGSTLSPLILAGFIKVVGTKERNQWWDSLSICYFCVACSVLIVIVSFLIAPELDVRREVRKKITSKSLGYSAYERILEFVAFCILTVAIMFNTEGVFSGFLYTYLIKTTLINKVNAKFLNSLFWLCFTVARLVALALSYYLKPMYLIIMNSLGLIISLSLMLIFRENIMVISVCVGIIGTYYSTLIPVSMGLPKSYMGIEVTGGMGAMINLATSTANFVSPILVTMAFKMAGSIGFVWYTMTLVLCSSFVYAIVLILFKKDGLVLGRMKRRAELSPLVLNE